MLCAVTAGCGPCSLGPLDTWACPTAIRPVPLRFWREKLAPVNHRPALNTESSSVGGLPSAPVLGDFSECVGRTARHRRAAPAGLAIPVIGQGPDRESVSPAVVQHLRQGAQGCAP